MSLFVIFKDMDCREKTQCISVVNIALEAFFLTMTSFNVESNCEECRFVGCA